MKTLLLVLCLFILAGCYRPGGGGTVHNPPDGIVSNRPTDIILTFSVWGAGSGRLDRRYTDVVCMFRVNNEEMQKLSGTVKSVSESEMEMHFTIPPINLKDGDKVAYNFEMLFDGHRNVRQGGVLAVKK